MVVKEEVESRDLVVAQTPVEVQTLLKEFDDVIIYPQSYLLCVTYNTI